MYNRILTLPHKRIVEIQPINGAKISLPYLTKSNPQTPSVHRCKSDKKTIVYPRQSILVDLPTTLKHCKYVSCSPSIAGSHYSWVKVENLLVNKGSINIPNNGSWPVILSKHEHFANVIPTTKSSFKICSNTNYN